MENMNNQGKTPQQYKDSENFIFFGIIVLTIIIVLNKWI